MNTIQRTSYDRFVRDMRRVYPVIQVRYPRSPMTHVSIYVSKHYDVAPFEIAQINDMGDFVYTGLHMYVFIIYHDGKRVCTSQVYMSDGSAYDAYAHYIDEYPATQGYSVCMFELAPIELSVLTARCAGC